MWKLMVHLNAAFPPAQLLEICIIRLDFSLVVLLKFRYKRAGAFATMGADFEQQAIIEERAKSRPG